MIGFLNINKPKDCTSHDVVLKLRKSLGIKKIGHSGTLDPFATGLLVVCVGPAVKLARYFLGAPKAYEGVIRFGQTTVSGDTTCPISESTTNVPESFEVINEMAKKFKLQPYLQLPPMHSAKKQGGTPLYKLARQGIEVEREHKLCHLFEFDILSYNKPHVTFRVVCSSGTYIRTLAQDFGRLLGSVALLEQLNRAGSGHLICQNALSVAQIEEADKNGQLWNELPCWIGFDRLLDGYERAYANEDEVKALAQGKQNVLINITRRIQPSAIQLPGQENKSCIAIYHGNKLVAVARQENSVWGLDRVFN